MENYKVIDMENLDRADYFQYFMRIGTIIEITKKLMLQPLLENAKLNP